MIYRFSQMIHGLYTDSTNQPTNGQGGKHNLLGRVTRHYEYELNVMLSQIELT